MCDFINPPPQLPQNLLLKYISEFALTYFYLSERVDSLLQLLPKSQYFYSRAECQYFFSLGRHWQGGVIHEPPLRSRFTKVSQRHRDGPTRAIRRHNQLLPVDSGWTSRWYITHTENLNSSCQDSINTSNYSAARRQVNEYIKSPTFGLWRHRQSINWRLQQTNK